MTTQKIDYGTLYVVYQLAEQYQPRTIQEQDALEDVARMLGVVAPRPREVPPGLAALATDIKGIYGRRSRTGSVL